MEERVKIDRGRGKREEEEEVKDKEGRETTERCKSREKETGGNRGRGDPQRGKTENQRSKEWMDRK